MIVLIDQISNSLPAQHPVGRIEIGLEDSRAEHASIVALRIDHILNAQHYGLLLVDVGCQLGSLGIGWH